MSSPGWTDEPITTTSADKLSRDGYAKRVAQLIATAHTWKSSTVFGLIGPWGSGKTSLVSLIENALNDQNDSGYSVVWFTPWATHDIGGLLSEFYSALTTALPKKRRDTARRAFSTLLRISAPAAAVIPFGGGAAAEAAESAADALVAQKPWEEAFREAAKKIRSSGKQVLVVVDDVDRLQGTELLTVLKVVRLLGRFPGVQYLLAYDHNSLMHTLTNAGAAQDLTAARRYIEKMVQYPIAVPALLSTQIDTLLNEQLEAVIERRRPGLQTSLDSVRQLSPTMQAMLTTPRAINRYVAQLDYELSVHSEGETHIEDVIILALLRTTLPELHNRLPHFQYELVTGNIHERTHGSTSSRDEKFSTDRLLDGLDDADKRHALKMLHMLFPKLRNSPSISRRQGVAQANYFGRYFAMTILNGYDIADADINQAVRGACEGAGEDLIALLRSDDSTLARLAIEKARESFTQQLHEASSPARKDELCTALLTTVVPVLDELGAPGRLVWALHDLATNWVGADVLPAISDAADRAPINQVMELAPSLKTRISILRAAKNSLTLRNQQWWKPVLAETLPSVQAEFLAHLREQDEARTERADLIDYFRTAHYAGVDLAPLQAGITDAIDAGQFEIDHLASRFINPDSANQFSTDQQGFDIIAPRVDYQWYQKPQEEFTADAGSWEGRRTLAAGRVLRPTDD